MDQYEDQTSPTRKITAWTLAIIGLVIAVSVSILVLLAASQADLHRSAEVASEYHLSSTARAGVIKRHVQEIERIVRHPVRDETHDGDEAIARVLLRLVRLIDREGLALQASQDLYSESAFDAPLRRLHATCDRMRIEVSMLERVQADECATVISCVAPMILRLDQFAEMHWNAYLSRDVLAEREAGWRRFSMLSIFVALTSLVPIGIATRQIANAVQRHHRTEKRRWLMQTELDHRVKNNLAAVLSLATQTIRSSADLHEFSVAFSGRILAMAKTHDALTSATWTGLDFKRAAKLTLATHLETMPPSVTLNGDDVVLAIRAATPVCLILHELATNAVKYGALAVAGGHVSLSWVVHDDRVDVTWVEQGGPVVVEPKSFGLGTQLIDGFIHHELRGEVSFDYRPEGLVCEFSLPLEEGARVSKPAAGRVRRQHRRQDARGDEAMRSPSRAG